VLAVVGRYAQRFAVGAGDYVIAFIAVDIYDRQLSAAAFVAFF
jgi:hypothetical protein